MQIQVNTDDHIEGREALAIHVQTEVKTSLSRFSEHLTRVEVHLSDENGGKSGSSDKRCLIEARPSGQQPVGVTHHASSVHEALNGAIRKLRGLLDTRFGQLHDHKGAPSIRDAEA